MGFGMRKEVYTRRPKKAFKKIKKAYEQEVKRNASKNLVLKTDKIDEDLKQRIRKKIRSQERTRISITVLATLIAILAIGILLNFLIENYMKNRDKLHPSKKVANLFNRKFFKKNNEVYQIADYYRFGGIASAFRIKDRMKHQNSESYYFTGEQFRTALYYYDSLIVEYYLYKTGDTISNYPKIDSDKIYHISLKHPKTNATIKFDVLDYKVLLDSYVEY